MTALDLTKTSNSIFESIWEEQGVSMAHEVTSGVLQWMVQCPVQLQEQEDHQECWEYLAFQ